MGWKKRLTVCVRASLFLADRRLILIYPQHVGDVWCASHGHTYPQSNDSSPCHGQACVAAQHGPAAPRHARHRRDASPAAVSAVLPGLAACSPSSPHRHQAEDLGGVPGAHRPLIWSHPPGPPRTVKRNLVGGDWPGAHREPRHHTAPKLGHVRRASSQPSQGCRCEPNTGHLCRGASHLRRVPRRPLMIPSPSVSQRRSPTCSCLSVSSYSAHLPIPWSHGQRSSSSRP